MLTRSLTFLYEISKQCSAKGETFIRISFTKELSSDKTWCLCLVRKNSFFTKRLSDETWCLIQKIVNKKVDRTALFMFRRFSRRHSENLVISQIHIEVKGSCHSYDIFCSMFSCIIIKYKTALEKEVSPTCVQISGTGEPITHEFSSMMYPVLGPS